jgi:hypothetical protein
MSKIVQLTASNVKRLSAVTITPDGSTVVIGGRHANGKSSVLDCIVYAITGTKSLPPVPLRRGASKGHIDLDLGDLKIRRTFTRKGEADYTTSLEVKRANGDKVASPQALLDSLCSSLAFDPLEFSRMKPKAQLEALKSLVNLDFADLDRERAEIYNRRTSINQQHAAKKAEAAAIQIVPGIGDKEVSVSERLSAIRQAEAANKGNADARKLLAQKESVVTAKAAEVKRLQDALAIAMRDAQAAVEAAAAQRELVNNLTADVDLAPLQEALSNAEAVNNGVRQNLRRAELVKASQVLSDQSDDLTRQIEAIDDRKAAAMKEAKFPVEGLSFGADGVLLHGLPLEQANTAAQIQLSVAMGLALNPQLRVMLIRDGSSLFADETGLGLVAKLAEEHDAQLWIERASVGEECSVIISDGMVLEPIEAEQEAEAVGA